MNAAVCADCGVQLEAGLRRCVPCARRLADQRTFAAVVEPVQDREEPTPRREPVPGGLSSTRRKGIRYRLAQEFKVPVRLLSGNTAAELRASAEAAAAAARAEEAS